MKHRLFTLPLALATLALPCAAHAQQPPHRALVGATLGVGAVRGGAYSDQAALWGYEDFHAGVSLALEGGALVTPWLSLGGRLGMLRSSAGHSSADAQTLSLGMYDLGAWARIGVPLGRAGARVRGFLGVQAEAGAVWATLDLRQQGTSSLAPRFAATTVAQIAFDRVALGLRAGPRFSWWNDAGGRGVDLDLGGVDASMTVEVYL